MLKGRAKIIYENIGKNKKKAYYNGIQVSYCPVCLSLNMISEDGLPVYCRDCGSVGEKCTSIEKWKKLYKQEQVKYEEI